MSGPARPAPVAPPVPRRSSAPQRSTPRTRARPSPASTTPLPRRLLVTLRSLPDHGLLDRAVRGRVWIGLLGVLLVGIVAMQVEVLKLNSDIGRDTLRAGQLQSQSDLLRSNVARLSDDQRIEAAAARDGLVMANPSAVRFLPHRASASELRRALANIHAPDATAFAAAHASAATSG